MNGLSTLNEWKIFGKGQEGAAKEWMRSGNFDLGILLPNSFRSAWQLKSAGVKRRVGYAREWRSWLLTDKLHAQKKSHAQKVVDRAKREAIKDVSPRRGGLPKVGGWEPVATVDYYLEIAKYLGAEIGEGARAMELGVTDEEKREAEEMLASQGFGGENLVIMVPGANFGSSKCWHAERFAQVADLVMDHLGEFDCHVLIASSAAELPIVERIISASHLSPTGRMLALAKMNGGKGVSLGALKHLVRISKLMICNDTGPRHFAAALGVPVVTLFGPTDPKWAEIFYAKERQVSAHVACGPCQLKKCPIDHRCMTGVTVEMVITAAKDLWVKPKIADWRDEPDVDPRTAMEN
jgi:heptosyltransferase-2